MLLVLVFLFVFYGKVLLNPNSYLFSEYGDGLKNYYTFIWQTHRSASYLHFDGLNFPYGEHINFIDSIPLLNFMLKPLGFFHSFLAGILNETILLSFLLCAFFLFRILKKYGAGNVASAAGAVAITLLSPQVERMVGHFALSYFFVIPMGWYLLLLYMEKAGLIRASLAGLYVFLLFFIHAYLGMMVGLFFFLSAFFFILSRKENLKNAKKYLHLLMVSILPAMLFFLFIRLTDMHEHRPENPFGFFYYTASWESIFLPNHPPINKFTNAWFNVTVQNWEGWAYVGITSVIAMLLFFIVLPLRKLKKNKVEYLPQNAWLFLLPAVLLLFFSMAYPFKWVPEEVLDWFPFVKQFRSVGRFAWIFYYVITVFSVLFMEKFFWKNTRFSYACKTIFLLLILLYVAEAIPYHIEKGEVVQTTPNLFLRSSLDSETENIIRIAEEVKIQAILPLPWVHIGSEFFKSQEDDASIKKSFLVSYHAHIPVLAAWAGRISISESKKMFNLFSPDATLRQELLNELPSDNPFLIIHSKNDRSSDWLLAEAEKKYAGEHFDAYLLLPDKITTARHFLNCLTNTDTLSDSLIVYRNGFDDTQDLIPNNGMYEGRYGDYSVLCEIEKEKLQPGKPYVAAVKFRWDYASDICAMLIAEWSSGQSLNWLVTESVSQTNQIYENHFVKHIVFSVPESEKGLLKIFVKGNDGSKSIFAADEIVVFRVPR